MISSTSCDQNVTKYIFQGILPPVLAETPKRATKFFTFEVYKKVFNSPDLHPAIVSYFAFLFDLLMNVKFTYIQYNEKNSFLIFTRNHLVAGRIEIWILMDHQYGYRSLIFFAINFDIACKENQ